MEEELQYHEQLLPQQSPQDSQQQQQQPQAVNNHNSRNDDNDDGGHHNHNNSRRHYKFHVTNSIIWNYLCNISILWDLLLHFWNEYIIAVNETWNLMVVLLTEPILDQSGLFDLSICLLILEHIGSVTIGSSSFQLLPQQQQPPSSFFAFLFDATFMGTAATTFNNPNNANCRATGSDDFEKRVLQQQSSSSSQSSISFDDSGIWSVSSSVDDGSTTTSPTTSIAGSILTYSPFGLFIALTAMFAVVVSNSNSNSTIFAPIWFRMMTRQTTASIMYLLLILFCFESILVLGILILACHTLLFPQYVEENLSLLFVLSGLWTTSLMASSIVRYNLYQSIGDRY